MDNRKLLPIIYAVSIASILPALLAITYPNQLGSPFTWLCFCLLTQYIFAFGAIAEMRNAQQLSSNDQKPRWRGLLLFSPLYFGFFYLRDLRQKSNQ